MPGRLAAKASSPYTTAVVSPWAAPRPAAPKAQAVTPSLGPQPPTFSGSAMASSASSIRGSRSAAGAVDPAALAARRNMARWPASTATDETSTPGQLRRPSSPSRASVSVVRTARRQREVSRLPRRRTTAAAAAPHSTVRTAAVAGVVTRCRAKRPASTRGRDGCATSSATPAATRTPGPRSVRAGPRGRPGPRHRCSGRAERHGAHRRGRRRAAPRSGTGHGSSPRRPGPAAAACSGPVTPGTSARR